ncbi:hypothetical protein PHMEG_00029620 [Phytophthora megakarya]|uniref:Cysteine-rich protein n=1 Tax=Phytophthora megakarya TaxID=4795 RepID=A0A225V4P3_9STRA|nr:hypothetical protein PHMEG_00029620 [Phytophthora megakarya]
MHLFNFITLASSLAVSLSNAYSMRGMELNAVAHPTVQYYVHVVANGEECDYPDKTLPMCANKNFVCRMKPGQEMYATAPSCLRYDPSNMQDNPYENEESAVAPWGKCNLTAERNRKNGDPPVCQRDFTCLCLHGGSENCICAPPDAVDDANGAAKCGSAMTTCTADKYCHYLENGGMECGQKPYYL